MSEASVTARLDRLEAIEAIRRVEAAYCDHWDADRAEEWAELFAPDGVFGLADGPHRPGHRQQGSAALREFCRTRQEGYQRFHQLLTMDIRVDGHRGWSRVAFQCFSHRTVGWATQELAVGYYDTSYARIDGAWRIAERIEHQVTRTDIQFFGSVTTAHPAGGLA